VCSLQTDRMSGGASPSTSPMLRSVALALIAAAAGFLVAAGRPSRRPHNSRVALADPPDFFVLKCKKKLIQQIHGIPHATEYLSLSTERITRPSAPLPNLLGISAPWVVAPGPPVGTAAGSSLHAATAPVRAHPPAPLQRKRLVVVLAENS